MINWSIELSIDWFSDRSFDWLTDWSIYLVIDDRSMDWLIDGLFDWLIDQLIDFSNQSVGARDIRRRKIPVVRLDVRMPVRRVDLLVVQAERLDRSFAAPSLLEHEVARQQ